MGRRVNPLFRHHCPCIVVNYADITACWRTCWTRGHSFGVLVGSADTMLITWKRVVKFVRLSRTYSKRDKQTNKHLSSSLILNFLPQWQSKSEKTHKICRIREFYEKKVTRICDRRNQIEVGYTLYSI